ncbi:MarR family winged helix-turn-helix transcriptional regulator [Streptomyces nodosus]
MSTDSEPAEDAGAPDVDEAIRAILLLMPRVVARTKRTPPPPGLRSFNLAPRHLSLMGYLVFDGPLGVNELARRLEVAPTTVSLMVGDLTRQGVLERREDPSDRRRAIIAIASEQQDAVEDWLAVGAVAWRAAFERLTPRERGLFLDTLRVYESTMAAARGADS